MVRLVGFNAGSALEANATAVLAFIYTNFPSAVVVITWIVCDDVKGKKPSALGDINW
jgi:Amt family ammonium transporter